MTKDFSTAIKERRSIYSISKETTISDDRIQAIIEEAVKYAPTAFNSQGGRVIALFGESHNNLWKITKEALRKIVPEDKFSSTEEKINSFAMGYGTILFFEDNKVTEGLQQQFPLYKDNFPVWAQQANGILQYIVWTSLANEGLGASLQHYNEVIDKDIRKAWDIPNDWKLIAQMPFGKPTSPAEEKDFMPLEERIKIFK